MLRSAEDGLQSNVAAIVVTGTNIAEVVAINANPIDENKEFMNNFPIQQNDK